MGSITKHYSELLTTWCISLLWSYYYLRTFFERFRITLTANGNLYKWPNKYTFIQSFFHKKYFAQFLICLSTTLRNCQLEADVRRLPVIVILNLSIIGWLLHTQPRPQGFSLKKFFKGKALGTRLLHTARVLISHKLPCCCPLPHWVVGAPPTASTGFKLLPLFSFSLLRQLTKRWTTRLAGGYRPASARWKLAREQGLWERKACAQTSFFKLAASVSQYQKLEHQAGGMSTACLQRLQFANQELSSLEGTWEGRSCRLEDESGGEQKCWNRYSIIIPIQQIIPSYLGHT